MTEALEHLIEWVEIAGPAVDGECAPRDQDVAAVKFRTLMKACHVGR